MGAGRARELPGVLAGLGTRALVCTGAHPDRHGDLLAALGLPYVLSTVDGEPTLGTAREVTATAREYGADVVLAIGGGSVLDLGKTVAMLLTNGGDPLEYLPLAGPAREIHHPALPCVAVPTTAGSGSEVTANAVLAVPEQRIKISLRSPLLLPAVALVDPVLAVGCPPSATAASGLDALTQCLEPFVSPHANPVTDSLAREGLRRAGTALRRAYADGTDLDARTGMALCALLGGMALANAKLGAVHGFAGVVGGLVDIPHGVACAALLVPVVEANIRAGAAPDRYAEAARLLTGTPDATVDDGVAWLRETVGRLGVPTLDAFGLRAGHASEVVAKAARSSSMQGNPVVLDDAELHRILAAATGPGAE